MTQEGWNAYNIENPTFCTSILDMKHCSSYICDQ